MFCAHESIAKGGHPSRNLDVPREATSGKTECPAVQALRWWQHTTSLGINHAADPSQRSCCHQLREPTADAARVIRERAYMYDNGVRCIHSDVDAEAAAAAAVINWDMMRVALRKKDIWR